MRCDQDRYMSLASPPQLHTHKNMNTELTVYEAFQGAFPLVASDHSADARSQQCVNTVCLEYSLTAAAAAAAACAMRVCRCVHCAAAVSKLQKTVQ
jgi:hypothetical protein